MHYLENINRTFFGQTTYFLHQDVLWSQIGLNVNLDLVYSTK